MAKTIFDDTPPRGTIVTADFLNAVNNHRHSGADADGAGALDYAVDSGSGNTYVITLSPALTAHVAGMPIVFKATHANTGAATLNVNGLGGKSLKKYGANNLEAGDIVSGQIVTVIYDGTYYQVAPVPKVPYGPLNYGVTTGTGTAYALSLSPPLASNIEGLPIFFKAHVANTGAATLNVNGLGAKAMRKKATEALVAGDIIAGQILIAQYDGTYFQIIAGLKPDSSTPIGAELFWPHGITPTGWLEENGQAISRTTYADLFAVIGTRYGAGDGSTTFNLPDPRGRFLRVWDHGAGVDPDRASRTDRGDGIAGNNVGTNQADEFKQHQHQVAADYPTSGTSDRLLGATSGALLYYPPTTLVGGNETRPINTYRMLIIKAF